MKTLTINEDGTRLTRVHTRFKDPGLLMQRLSDIGLHPEMRSYNEITVSTEGGTVHFSREKETDAFLVKAPEANAIKTLQSEEILEDDTILLTLQL